MSAADGREPGLRRAGTMALPPRDFLPAAVHPALDVYEAALGEWDDLALRLTDIDGELQAADRADAALIVAAMRAGDETENIGTPTRDQVEREHRTLGHQEAAAHTLLLEAQRKLVHALGAAKTAAVAEVDQLIADAAEGYAAAATELLQRRRSYQWARERRAWWLSLGVVGANRWPMPPAIGFDDPDLERQVFELRNAALVDTGAQLAVKG